MSKYQIDPVHSAVHFQIRHLNIANFKGQFGKVTGTVNFDPDNPEASTVDAQIDVNSLLTRDEKRDAHLKAPDFFHTEAHPLIAFKSKSVGGAGSNSFNVVGDLTFRGHTKPAVLLVNHMTGEVKDMWGNLRRGAEVHAKIKRSDFGMTFNAPLEGGGVLLSDEVGIEIDLQMMRQP